MVLCLLLYIFLFNVKLPVNYVIYPDVDFFKGYVHLYIHIFINQKVFIG